MATLGAILKRLGYECDLYYQSMPGMKEERLRRYDIVGISFLTNQTPEAYALADSAKRDGATIVLGGPHATFMAEEALGHCDYVVFGEGDASFPGLVAALAKEESPSTVPGLAYRLPTGEVHHTGPADAVDYAGLPSPDFSLSPQVKPGRIPPIIATSRGCPHNCTFCIVTSVFGRRYRFKRNEQTIDELQPILNRSVCIADDNFCAHPARTKSLLRDMIEQRAVPLRWAGEMTVKAGSDEELLGLMRQTRCRTMYVGIESVNAGTLKKYGKSHDVEAIGRCVENLHRHNIGIHGMFVVDMTDNVQAVREIVDYAIAADIDTIQIFALTPYPGTTTWRELQDRLLHREWKYYDGMHVVAEPANCSAYDLQMAIVRGMQRFYGLRRVVGAYRRRRGWRLKYMAGGYYIIRRWVRENAGYLERLRTGYYSPSAPA